MEVAEITSRNFQFYDDKIDGIMTLSTASNRRGLCHFNSWFLQILTDKSELKGIELPMCQYIYYPNVDRVNYLESSSLNSKLFIPTKERTLVDYIILEDEYGDEGILIESLQNYLRDYEEDLPKLYEVADFYNLPRETLEYWLNEARNETDMSMG